MDAEKVALGALLLAVSFGVLAQTVVAARTPFSLAALGSIGLSVGSLLVDSVGR